MDFCTDYSVLHALSILIKIYHFICVIIPIIIIIKLSIDIFKTILSDDKNDINNLIATSAKRITMGVIIFFLPTLTEAFVNLLNNHFKADIPLMECINNIENLDYYKELNTVEQQVEQTKATPSKPPVQEIIKNTEPELKEEEVVVGKLYSLTDSEITYLASICELENDGAMEFEASLMLNLFEQQSKYKTIYDYCSNNWFSTRFAAHTHTPSQKAKDAVISVIVNGNRVTPSYVNEHYYRPSIAFIVVNGKKISDKEGILDKNNYIRGNTIIYEPGYEKDNDVGWYFYEFPCSSCDPFGYKKDPETGQYAPRFHYWD